MIPPPKRKFVEAPGTNVDGPASNENNGHNQVTENWTRSPHVQVAFTADTTVVGSNSFHDSEDLHPIMKYGIPIGAMFLLGLFMYATFSKRWNRKAAMSTIAAESMKFNSTTSVDTIAEYVSCQIADAEKSVLRKIEGHLGKISDAIINDIPIANEEELMSGLRKTMIQQETKLKYNIRKKFEETISCIVNAERDKFTAADAAMDLFKNDQREVNKSESALPIHSEHLNNRLSDIQNIILPIVKERITNAPDSLLAKTQQNVLQMTDLINNIIPKTLQDSEDWNRTRYSIKQMEETLIKEITAVITEIEENVFEYIQGKINECEQISTAEVAIPFHQNDLEVDIKQPGKVSTNESHSDIQMIAEKISSVKANNEGKMAEINKDSDKKGFIDDKINAGGGTQKQILEEQTLCSRCAAAKNNSEEPNIPVTTEIIDTYDKMEEHNLKRESENIVSSVAINEGDKSRGESKIVPPKNETKPALNKHEILEISEGTTNNISVRDESENSLKLWLSRFKQAVPHIPDNSFKKYEESVNRKNSEDNIVRRGNNHVVIDMSGTPEPTQNLFNILTKPLTGNHIDKSATKKHKHSNGNSETTEVEIHRHPDESEGEIDNKIIQPGDLMNIEELQSDEKMKINTQHSQTDEYTPTYVRLQSEDPRKDNTIKITISEHNNYDKPEIKESFSVILLNNDEKIIQSEGLVVTESQNLDVKSFIQSEKNAPNYEISEESNEKHTTALKEKEEFPEPLLNVDCPPSGIYNTEQLKARADNSDATLLTICQQAQENASDYKEFENELENEDNLILTANNGNRNTDDEKQKEYEKHVENPRKWFNIDEILEGEKVSWPSHLPKIVDKSTANESDLNMTELVPAEEETKIKFTSQRLYEKESPVSKEEAIVSSAKTHEEIIKICQGLNSDNYQLATNTEKSDEEGIKEMNENKIICPDRSQINEKNFNEDHVQNILIIKGRDLLHKESDEAANVNIFYGDYINEKNTEKQYVKMHESTSKEQADDKKNNVFNRKEWSDTYEKMTKESENFKLEKHGDGKEAVASASSYDSPYNETKQNEPLSSEKSRKEKENDTLPVLKLPNMDDKLRKKRKINRRQLKSLDSGVHHYYGEYIAIEFPINELDEASGISPESDKGNADYQLQRSSDN